MREQVSGHERTVRVPSDRNTAGIEKASSTEFGETPEPVVGIITEWMSKEGLQQRAANGDLGGTMRLGAYEAKLAANSHVSSIYGGSTEISERHRHRYEFNNEFREQFEAAGFIFSGTSPDGRLVEIIEVADHPWFVACQFHPEFISRPNRPQPFFREFVRASIDNK